MIVTLEATKPVRFNTPNGLEVFVPGELFDGELGKAQPFIDRGLFKLVEKTSSSLSPLSLSVDVSPEEVNSDEFKKAFLSIYARATDTFHIWAVSTHKKAIHKALSGLDDAWGDRDYSSLKGACEAIERLILKAWADDYSKRKEAVRIYSEVVGDYVYLVSNESIRSHMKSEGLACYTPEEIIHMGKLSSEAIKALHRVKKQFGGDTRIVS